MNRAGQDGKESPLKRAKPRPDDPALRRREERLRRTLASNMVVLRMMTGK